MLRHDSSQQIAALYTVGVAILATVAALPLAKIFGLLGVNGGTPISELLIAMVLMWIYPERSGRAWSFRLVAVLIAGGALMGISWIITARMIDYAVFPKPGQFPSVAIWLGFLTAVVTAPIYEEKVVRQLLLDGVSSLTNFWVGALVVSVLFGLAHNKDMIGAFILSMALCWSIARFGLNTYQRAIIHGVYNLVIMAWYFTQGFGGLLP